MPKPVGNPDKRRRGEVVRAVIMATVKPDRPVPVETMTQTVGLSRVSLLRHLATLQETNRIVGYTTARGMVRVW